MQKFLHKGRAIELSPEEEKRQVEQGLPIWHLPCHLVFQKGKYRFCHDEIKQAHLYTKKWNDTHIS